MAAGDAVLSAVEQMVFRVALRLMGSVEDAQDVAQEVFLKLHGNLRKIEEARGVEAWLYRVTVNACNDALRGRRKHVSIEDWDAPVAAVEDPVALEQRRKIVTDGLARLPEKERAALVLREIEGLSTAEVAALLGSSEATVRSQVSTAKAKLRTFVEKVWR